jgi:hypothetical protein
MKRFGVLVVLCITLSCAELKVKVDVASPQIVENRLGRLLMRDSLPDALRQAKEPGEVKGLIGAARALLRRQYVEDGLKVPDAHTTRQATSVQKEKQRRDALETQFSEEIAPQYAALEQRWLSINTSIDAAYERFSLCDRCYSRWRESLNRGGLWSVKPPSRDKERNAEVQSEDNSAPLKATGSGRRANKNIQPPNDNECASVHVRPDCGDARFSQSYLIALLKEREGVIQQLGSILHHSRVERAAVAAAAPLHSLIGEDGLFRSAEAYAVVAADDSMWTEKFDDSRALAFFGDVNVALKMETRGSFTVKGLSFDPSEIARVASRVVTQTLVAATQPASLAVLPKRQRAEADETGVNTIAELGERQRQRREALLSVANAVLEEEAAFKEGGAVDQAAHDAVESITRTWSALKPLVLLEPEKVIEADVVGVVPDKVLLAPNQATQLLVVLSRKRDDELPIVVESKNKDVVTVTTPLPVTIASGTQSRVIDIRAAAGALGSAEISASDAEGHSQRSTACVLPVITIADAALAGPKKTGVLVALKAFDDNGAASTEFRVPSDTNLTVSSAGADVKVTDVLLIPKGQGSAALMVSPRESGEINISVALSKPGCPARVATKLLKILQAKLSLKCPEKLSIGKEEDCTIAFNDDPGDTLPDGVKFTPSSDSDTVSIVNDAALQPASKNDVEHLKFKVRAKKVGTANIKLVSNLSIFADPELAGIEVTETSAEPVPQP